MQPLTDFDSFSAVKRILHAMSFILHEEIERDAKRKKERKKEGKKGRTNLCIRSKDELLSLFINSEKKEITSMWKWNRHCKLLR